MHDGPGGEGLSRKAILEQVDASLKRLGTDYIDLYQIHRFDPDTPVEETMEALHDVIKAGKTRYIGASSMFAWQFAKLQHAADLGGWTRFVSMQNQYNLLRRHDEPELMAMCGDMGVGLVPYSPNGKGRLACAGRRAEPPLRHRQGRPGVRLPLRRAGDRRRAGARRDTRREHGLDRAGLGFAQPACLGSDRRRNEAAPPAGRGRRAHRGTDGRRGARARGALPPVRAVVVLTQGIRRSRCSPAASRSSSVNSDCLAGVTSDQWPPTGQR